MREPGPMLLVLLLAALPPSLPAQVLVTGQILGERTPGSGEELAYSTILCFASLAGGDCESLSFRTWETAPAGWFRLSGPAGRYTILFSNPVHFMRPILRTNVFTRAGERIDLRLSPRLDYACFAEDSWDVEPASEYFQTFTARGHAVTHVGFKLATDGVDGVGPGSQTVLLSVHRRGEGSPESWPQVGPTRPVVEVDCGGPKGYHYSAGWLSGEVPIVPGEIYAVRLRPERPGAGLQTFWGAAGEDLGDCYRVGRGATGFQGKRMWMAVGTDGDGLLLPYTKTVHHPFHSLTTLARRWSQTWVAQGRGLAGAILYAAVSGRQPPLARQRVVVRVRRGGPEGAVVGTQKIAVGNGNYTGDASWGTFGVAFAPGEVALEPGESYALEFESIESLATLEGFVNIKGEVSDGRPGFNPYRKHPRDAYPGGTAFLDGKERMDFDLDMQVIEYGRNAPEWGEATTGGNLVSNGGMDEATRAEGGGNPGLPASWLSFTRVFGTLVVRHADAYRDGDPVLRVGDGDRKGKGKAVDGGAVQRVDGLRRDATYRLEGRLRASWPVDIERGCHVGYDPTGQVGDPEAATIVWTVLPALHGIYVPFRHGPVRPARDAVSIWLRARTDSACPFPFHADFDDIALRRVPTGVPTSAD